VIILIDAYKIKVVDGEERLFIYLNFNYEFASFNFNNSKRSLIKIIKDYIKKNNIAYKGALVSLIVGGMFLGSVNLNEVESMDTNHYVVNPNNIVDVSNINIEKENNKEINKVDGNKKIEEKDNIVASSDTKESISNVVKKETKTEVKTVNKSSTTENKNNTSKSTNSNTKSETSTNKVEEKVVDNSIYVKVKRSNGTITLELEEYLIGVVGSEMPASFNIEALKAQAVVARTYVLKAIQSGKTLTDNVSTQTYKDNNELKKTWGSSFDTYYSKVKNAVNSTKGEYLTYNGKIIDAVYHSTSNGKTENAKNVWGNSIPYLVSVDSPFDNLNPSYEKTVFVSYTDVSSKLKLEINTDTTIKLVGTTEGDRVSFVNILDKSFTGVEFRTLLGLRSADFDIEKTDTGLNIITKGYGHGVGMSQYGANGMAKNGSNYKEILKHYYKGVIIQNK